MILADRFSQRALYRFNDSSIVKIDQGPVIDVILGFNSGNGDHITNNRAKQIYESIKSINSYKQYSGIWSDEEALFIRLITRLGQIHESIENRDSAKFLSFIKDHGQLRRKLSSINKRFMSLMGYESELLKYGKYVFSGKPVHNYKHLSDILNVEIESTANRS